MEGIVTIIIPVYNVEKYLCQCLESVINQSYCNLEILIVDDGSTDGSGAICDEYANKDKRITVYHTENGGLSAARNYAIDRAHGEYLAFLDSDDWLRDDAIQRFLDTAIATGADIVACRFYQEYVNESGESSGPKRQFVVEGDEILRIVTIDRAVSNDVWNKFYRANLFNSIRYPEGRLFEDYATTYKLLQVSTRLSYIPDCLIHYRNRENSISNAHAMNNLVDYWWVFHQRFETMSSISDEYYRVTLSDCIGAVSRMWRWYAGCSKEEKKRGTMVLDEMQSFVEKHREEIKTGSYSRHIKLACQYTKSQNSILLKLLYLTNKLYRSANQHKYYEM